MNNIAKNHIHAIDFASESYPKCLKCIKNAPKIIYASGNLDLFYHNAAVAVVGTRDASTNGLKITSRVTKYLVERDVAIVSGLALGIDAAAHLACMEARGLTIAVLAHGLDMIYPAENRHLAQNILAENGLLVSEHPPGTKPQKHFFVQRNRIQVGLSKVSVVIEAGAVSGTTSHAKFCVEAQHKLFVILPDMANTFGLNYHGPKMMVEEMGAIPIMDKNDYLNLDAAIFA